MVQYGLPLAEAVFLLATLLSLPLSTDYAPLTFSPEQQKQKTLQTLLTILLRIAAQQPVLFVMEDLHWIDPSTLELLTLLVDQGPTARILALFTCRPDFSPPWTGRAHLTQMTLNRLPRRQAVEVIRQVAHGKVLPPEVVEQIVAKTDGVPLFVEELTKMVLESGLLQEGDERYELTGPLPPLAIPATLHDSLMARLDRLASVKDVAQLGATLGREFAYDLLQAVAPWTRPPCNRGCTSWWRRSCSTSGAAAAGDLPLQACPDSGCRLSVVAAEHPPAVSSAHCAGVGGTVPGDCRDATRAAGAPLHRGGTHSAGHPLLAAGGPARASSARPIWKRWRTSRKAWRCSPPCQTPPSALSRSCSCRPPWAQR